MSVGLDPAERSPTGTTPPLPPALTAGDVEYGDTLPSLHLSRSKVTDFSGFKLILSQFPSTSLETTHRGSGAEPEHVHGTVGLFTKNLSFLTAAYLDVYMCSLLEKQREHMIITA